MNELNIDRACTTTEPWKTTTPISPYPSDVLGPYPPNPIYPTPWWDNPFPGKTVTLPNLSVTSRPYEIVSVGKDKILYEIEALHVDQEDVDISVVDDNKIVVVAKRNFNSKLIDSPAVGRVSDYKYPTINITIPLKTNEKVLRAALENGVIKVLVLVSDQKPNKVRIGLE